MRRRRAASNSPASALRRFGSSTVARFGLIRSFLSVFPVLIFPAPGCTVQPLPAFRSKVLSFLFFATPYQSKVDRICQSEPAARMAHHPVSATLESASVWPPAAARFGTAKTPYLAGFSWPQLILERGAGQS